MSAMPNITLNVELFIKLMGMTTSSNDGESLAALRAANRALAAGGGNWESLLRGKLAPIDPFASLPEPPRATATTRPRPSQPPPPPPPRRTRGIDAKEAREITSWLVILEFATLDPSMQHEVNHIDSEWKTYKAIKDLDYSWLKRAAAIHKTKKRNP